MNFKDEPFARMGELMEEHPWAFDEARRIVQAVEPDGRMTYQLPAGRKVRLTIEVCKALVAAACMSAAGVAKKNAEARTKLRERR